MVEQFQLAAWMMGWPADLVVEQGVDWVVGGGGGGGPG